MIYLHLGVDISTMYAKYTFGSFTVGYQQSENDGPTSTDTDESDSWGVSYAVNDDFSVSFGAHTLDLDLKYVHQMTQRSHR